MLALPYDCSGQGGAGSEPVAIAPQPAQPTQALYGMYMNMHCTVFGQPTALVTCDRRGSGRSTHPILMRTPESESEANTAQSRHGQIEPTLRARARLEEMQAPERSNIGVFCTSKLMVGCERVGHCWQP